MRKIMTRTSKQEQRRNMSPRKRHVNLAKKTGPKKDLLEKGYKEHVNALDASYAFIPKIK